MLPLASPIINWLQKKQEVIASASFIEHVPRHENTPQSNLSQAVAFADYSKLPDTGYEQGDNDCLGKKRYEPTTNDTHEPHYHMNLADKCPCYSLHTCGDRGMWEVQAHSIKDIRRAPAALQVW